MSARDDVLASVRRALGGPRGPVDVPRDYTRGRQVDDATVDLFVERVADYRAVVVRCAPDDVEAHIADALVPHAEVVLPDGFGWIVPGAVRDEDLSAADLDGLDGVVTAATVGIAETGTIVLSHGPGEGRRALTLVPDKHVCVVRADQVVAAVPDAVALLDPARPTTWISGPSATSDIELDRVEGVHGPRHLHVIVVDAPVG